MVTRRRFLKYSAIAGASLLVQWHLNPGRALASPLAARLLAATAQIPLPGKAIPQFVDPLPDLDAIVAGPGQIVLSMREFKTNVLPNNFVLPNGQPYGGTWVWGYLQPGQTGRASYLGPVIVATRGTPTEIKWVNALGFADPYGNGGFDPNQVTNVLAYSQSTDQTLHWADPLHDGMNMLAHMAKPPAPGSEGARNYTGPIPAVPHLHGGEVPPRLDGGPAAWFTSDGLHHGSGYHSWAGHGANGNEAIYRYPNGQEAAPIWFHDHSLGATRLAVYAGLAGGYLITDPLLALPANLPGPGEIIPLVIQDRSFDTSGQFFLPADSYAGIQWATNPEHPYWVPEFVGDTIVINGKAWPTKAVERKRYRFLLINGSNARAYEMFLVDPVTKVMGPPMWVIGTDGGYLDRPVKIDPNALNAAKGQPVVSQRLVMLPGERYEIIIDFNDPAWLALNPNFSGKLILKNVAKTPYPGGASPQGTTLGQMMQFMVGAAPAGGDPSYDPASGIPLRPPMIRLVKDPIAGTVNLPPHQTAPVTRQLTLNEVMGMPQTATNPVTGQPAAYPGGPLEILVNNTKYNGDRITGVESMANGDLMYTTQPIPGFTNDGSGNYLSELPNEGDTEVWEIVNLTADAHPIHIHLVQFQLINRQAFDVAKYSAAYAAAFSGGGWDPMTNMPYAGGVFIPGFGPPKSYDPAGNPLSAGKYGGNPDVKPFLKSQPSPALAYEAGWKDTAVMYPGQVTRIAVRWAPTDLATNLDRTQLKYPFDPSDGQGYVWHCHIIDHEDNEMMRPDQVVAQKVNRTYVTDTDY